jgi:DNA-binding beta-propeller fold protein YncE
MKMRFAALLLVAALVVPSAALAAGVPEFDYATPVFGLAVAPDGSLLVADTGAGLIELRKGTGSQFLALPGVADVAPIGRGDMLALTGGGPDADSASLYRVSRGQFKKLANLADFEAANNPAGGPVESNPFDVAVLSGGEALVADAAGNDLLVVNQRGGVDWVATFPSELVSTSNARALVGCPTPLPGFEFACGLPPMIPAEPVPTSVAIGPDGAYYVGELKGFPAPTGASQVWRIEPGTRHAECGSSPACTVVAGGFTSIVDLAFGPDGTLYVVELDEASWAAVEFGLAMLGGTVNACNVSDGSCSVVASGLTMPTAVAVNRGGTVYAAVSSLIPGAAEVITLP